MKKLFSAVVLALAAVLLSSCGKPKEVLTIYNWGDYISPEVVKKFEKEFNCKVKVDVFDSNEAMYAKLKAGAKGYDIVVPSSYMAELMQKQNMLAALDHKLLPNVTKYVDKSYTKLSLDKELKYTVPYFASFTGIGYNTKKVKDFVPSWRMFERADLKGRCSLLNDLREVIGIGLLMTGHDMNSTNQKDLDEAVKQVLVWKKNIAKFEVDDAKRALAAGEFVMIQTYSGDMLQVSSENKDADEFYDYTGKYISPGFIEIHTHGAGGYAFINTNPENVIKACEYHLDHGTTSILPTVTSGPFKNMRKAVEDIETAKKSGKCKSNIIGAHMEGPYFSLKQAGAQCPDFITPPVKEDYESLKNKIHQRPRIEPERIYFKRIEDLTLEEYKSIVKWLKDNIAEFINKEKVEEIDVREEDNINKYVEKIVQ